MAVRPTLIRAIDALQGGVDGRLGLHAAAIKRIAELAPEAAKLLQEVATHAVRLTDLQHDDDLDPAFRAAEAALDAFWGAVEIVGLQRAPVTTHVPPTTRTRKPAARPATRKKATA